MVLAGFLARNGQIKASLDLIKDKWAACDPTYVAQAISTVITSGKASREQREQAEAIMKDALKKFSRPPLLLLVIADYYNGEHATTRPKAATAKSSPRIPEKSGL